MQQGTVKWFNAKKGYEDVAMGLDALYANLDIWISDNIKIVHKSHERTAVRAAERVILVLGN